MPEARDRSIEANRRIGGVHSVRSCQRRYGPNDLEPVHHSERRDGTFGDASRPETKWTTAVCRTWPGVGCHFHGCLSCGRRRRARRRLASWLATDQAEPDKRGDSDCEQTDQRYLAHAMSVHRFVSRKGTSSLPTTGSSLAMATSCRASSS